MGTYHFTDFPLHQQLVVWASFFGSLTTLAVRLVAARLHRDHGLRRLHLAVAAVAGAYSVAYLVLIFGRWTQPEWANVTRWLGPLVWAVLGVAPVFLASAVASRVESRVISRAMRDLVEGGDDA